MAGVGLTFIINILLIVHALRTGRPYYWIFIIMWPVIGPITYFLVELLPDLSNDYRARRAVRGIRRSIDPNADLRRHQRQDQLSGSVDAKRHLAAELGSSGRYDEAIDVYREALTGLYENDPDLMLGLAQAFFGNGNFDSAHETLEKLIEFNPDFKSPEGHLLYARSAEACGDTAAAIEEYEIVSLSYPGPEARIHFAALLEREGQFERALAIYNDIINASELGPRHFRKIQREWINAAKDGQKRLR